VVKNKGQASESFDTSAFYNSTMIDTEGVELLAPGEERVLGFVWITWGVAPGNYTISARANAVPGEVNLGDNVFVDGYILVGAVVPPTRPPFDSRWFLALLFILIMLIAILLVVLMLLLFARRRKKKEEEKAGLGAAAVLPSEGVKRCRVCGKEFPVAFTFCPYCLSFYGKDSEE
jgi:hypothetical protein